MSGLDDLPADQRAVLELVLARGRDYDQIAQVLRVDRAGVRQRALSAFDALGPETGVPAARRALIADYLLGQLPPQFAETVRGSLASQPGDRAWARVIASELGPIATAPLPEIPPAAPEARAGDVQVAAVAATPGAALAPGSDAAAPLGPSLGPAAPRRSSRLGGAILLGLGALIVIAVIVVVITNSGGSSHKSNTAVSNSSTTSATGTGTGTTASPTVLAQTSLTPASSSSKARGEAEVFLQSGKQLLAVVAENLTPNSHNFYAVWLSNGGSDTKLLGFAPTVTSNGQLEAATQLASNAGHYKRLLLTLETQPHPKGPGTVILSGPFSLK